MKHQLNTSAFPKCEARSIINYQRASPEIIELRFEIDEKGLT